MPLLMKRLMAMAAQKGKILWVLVTHMSVAPMMGMQINLAITKQALPSVALADECPTTTPPVG